MNKISIKKIILFFILITLFTIILLINTDFKRFLDNEAQVVLSKKKLFRQFINYLIKVIYFMRAYGIKKK